MTNPENSPPDPVSQGIIELVDATFERVAPHIGRFATDERRQTDDGGAILVPHKSVMHDVKRHYGFLELRPHNKGSFVDMREVFLQSPIAAEAINPSLVEDSALRREHRLKIVAGVLIPVILKDYYPQGNAGHRVFNGEMWGREDYNPAIWGLRHRAGIKLRLGLENDQNEAFHWNHEISVQHRFDRQPPQFKAEVMREIPATGQEEHTRYERKDQSRDATLEDVALFKALFAATKNLRPTVMPIRPFMKNKKFVEKLWQGSSGENLAA